MKKHDDFDMDDLDLDLGDTQPEPKEKPFSFNDLDLGLDFDLSFLDDIEDPEETKEPPKPAAPQEPIKRPAPVQAAPAAPAAQSVRRPAAPAASSRPAASQNPQRPVGTPSGQRPVNANGQRPGGGMPPHPANAQRGMNGQRPAGTRPTGGQRPAGSPSGQRPAGSPNGQRPAGASGQRPAARRPMPAQEAPATKKKKSGPRLGGVIFYTLYFLFILVFFLGTFIGLNWLHGWLTDFELAQPGPKAEQVFTQLFTNPDWGALYESAGAKDSAYEGKDAYVTYMQNKVGDQKLTYLETSAGLSGDKKYVVRLGSEKVAAFTLTDKNKATATDTKLDNLSKIPDWQLSTVEVYFDRQDTYYVVKLDGHTAMVNDVALDDDTIIQVATTKAEDYLPEGTTGASMCTQQVSGLMAQPVVTIFDRDGNQMEVTYDEATRTFTERLESNTMSDDQRAAAVKAAETYCNWMLAVDNDRGHAAQIFDPTGDAYKTLTSITRDNLWVQSNNGFTFDNMNVTDFALYNGDIFSVRVTMDVNVTRTDGSIKNYPYASSLFFRKNDAGKWMCFNSTNADVSEPVGRVRLTFMNGETEIDSRFYGTDAKEIVTPVVSTPEGKVFTGWVTIDQDENGAKVYNLQFQPDEEGKVSIPDGVTLKPMTLYALFQNPGEQTTIPTASAETTGDATAETTAATEGA